MDYDVIVIGGGHAGIEAAMASARMGAATLLVTQQLDAVGRLSCNPSIGGVAKGNIVREIDALGGVMGLLIDKSMIQFRILNRSRGPAVQAYRAQADKNLYSSLAKQTLERQKNLSLFQDTVVDFILSEDSASIKGVVTERGNKITSKAVVLTTGTFMEGKIFIGSYEAPDGRLGEKAAVGLGTSLRRMGFTLGRLKTGTPARVHRDSLDYSKMQIQPGDRYSGELPYGGRGCGFSFETDFVDRPDVPCFLTYTNEKTHKIITDNINLSPLYGGKIQGIGPRYCPSIEDKVMRFPQRNRHHIFIEPEGLSTDEMYLNGLSSSLPEWVQRDFIHSIPGLENAEIMRPGYAVEYDFIDPRQLKPSLETKRIRGLFSAGQTNGTSGYEEAGGQGLLAGINAVQYTRGGEPLVLGRDEAYIGVLVDDLVTLGTKEPYRMFTARAEYRLRLRNDTADERLTPKAFALGAAEKHRMERLEEKTSLCNEIKELLQNRKVVESDIEAFRQEALEQEKNFQRKKSLGFSVVSREDFSDRGEGGALVPENLSPLEMLEKNNLSAMKGKLFSEILSLPGINPEMLLRAFPELVQAGNSGSRHKGAGAQDTDRGNAGGCDVRYSRELALEKAWLDLKYRHYIETQEKSVSRLKKLDNLKIPLDFDYDGIPGLSAESRIKLKEVRPETLGQASRISGIRTSDVMLLMVKLR